MLSRPMKGKTREQIEKEMVDVIFDMYDHMTCEIISPIVENREEKSELECFSESIFFMSKADVLAMGFGWENSRGCRLEHDIAKAYGVPVIYLDDNEKKAKRDFTSRRLYDDNSE